MKHASWEDDSVFEDEVRRIARCMWPKSEFGGSANITGRERDDVFETDDCLHIVEATTSKHKVKALQDIQKLCKLSDHLKNKVGWRSITCWFVTASEPTADQRGVVPKNKADTVHMLSFRQFESKLIDASSYLSLRMNFRFGSVRDPIKSGIIPATEYVRLDLMDNSNEIWSTANISTELQNGGRILLLGDYGAGKSMTMREVFLDLRRTFLKGKSAAFPIYINMRGHFGQDDPAEILERHARQIGFPNPSHLVRAWLAGYAILLIDGFDEVTTLGMQGARKKLRETRFRSMEGVRRLSRDTHQQSGIAIAGRPHFFDNESERRTALALNAQFIQLTLSDFNEEQLAEFIVHSGYKDNIPSWIPMRPLLVAYLTARGLIESGDELSEPSREDGWNSLIERISNREAEIEAGIDGQTVRRILERLAIKARASQGGLGPITPEQVIQTFEEICGYSPDSEAMLLLQRLPGLGVDSSQSENRTFVDSDFADACRSGDIVQYVNDPFNFTLSVFDNSENCLDELGVGVAVVRLPLSKIPQGKMLSALHHACDEDSNATLRADVIRVAGMRGDEIDHPVYIKEVLINTWDLGAVRGNLSKVVLQRSYFGSIEFDEGVDHLILPKFFSCFFARVEGRSTPEDLPKNAFDGECVFDSFSEGTGTTDGILELTLPLGSRVLLTILRKLYLQRGSGRRETALLRGLDQRSRRLVPDILAILNREGLATCQKVEGRSIWFPNRMQLSRISKILASPHERGDVVLHKAGEVT